MAATGFASDENAGSFKALMKSPITAKPPVPGPLNAGSMSLYNSPKVLVKELIAAETQYVDRRAQKHSTTSRGVAAPPSVPPQSQPQSQRNVDVSSATPAAEARVSEVPIDMPVAVTEKVGEVQLTPQETAAILAALPPMPVLEVCITLPSPEPLAPLERMDYRDVCREIAAVLTQREAETNAAMRVLEKQQQDQHHQHHQHQGRQSHSNDAAASFLSPGAKPSSSIAAPGVRVVGTLRVQSYATASSATNSHPVTSSADSFVGASSFSPIQCNGSEDGNNSSGAAEGGLALFDGQTEEEAEEEAVYRALGLVDYNKSAFRFRAGGVGISARTLPSSTTAVSHGSTSSKSASAAAATCHVVLTVRVPDSLPGVVRAFSVPQKDIEVAALMEGPSGAVDAITAVKTVLASTFSQGLASYLLQATNGKEADAPLSPMAHVISALKSSILGDNNKGGDSAGLALLKAACRVYPHAHLTPAESEMRVQSLILKVRAEKSYHITPPLAPLVQTRLGSTHVTDADKKAFLANLKQHQHQHQASKESKDKASASTTMSGASTTPATPTASSKRSGAGGGAGGSGYYFSRIPSMSPVAPSAIGAAIGQAIGASINGNAASNGASRLVPASPAAKVFAASNAAILASGGRGKTAPKTPGGFASDSTMLPLLATINTPVQLGSKRETNDGAEFSIKSIPAIDVDGTSKQIQLNSASKARFGNNGGSHSHKSKHGGSALTFTFSSSGSLMMTPGSAKRAQSRLAVGSAGGSMAMRSQGAVNRPGVAASFMSPLAAAAGISAAQLQQKMGFKSPISTAVAGSGSGLANHPAVASNPFFDGALPMAMVRYTSLLDEGRNNGAEPASFDRDHHRNVLLTLQKGLENMSLQRRQEEEHMRLATRAKPAKHPRGGYHYTDIDTGFGVAPRDYEKPYMQEVHYAENYVNETTTVAWEDERKSRLQLMACWSAERVAKEQARVAADKEARVSWWDQEVDEDVEASNSIDLNAAVLKAAEESKEKKAAKKEAKIVVDEDEDDEIVDVVVDETFGSSDQQHYGSASAGAFLHALIHSVARSAASQRERTFNRHVNAAIEEKKIQQQAQAEMKRAQQAKKEEEEQEKQKATATAVAAVQLPFEPLATLVGGSTALLQLKASLDCLLDAAITSSSSSSSCASISSASGEEGGDNGALQALYAGVAKAAIAYAAFKGVSVTGAPTVLEETFISSGAAALFKNFEASAEVAALGSGNNALISPSVDKSGFNDEAFTSPAAAAVDSAMMLVSDGQDASAIRSLLGIDAEEGQEDGNDGAFTKQEQEQEQEQEPEAFQVLRDAVITTAAAMEAAASAEEEEEEEAVARSGFVGYRPFSHGHGHGPFAGICLQAAAPSSAASEQLAAAVMMLAGVAPLTTTTASAAADEAAAGTAVVETSLTSTSTTANDDDSVATASTSTTASSIVPIGATVRSLNFDSAAPCSPIMNGASAAAVPASVPNEFSLDAQALEMAEEQAGEEERQEEEEEEEEGEPTFSELLGNGSSTAAEEQEDMTAESSVAINAFSFSSSARRVLEQMEASTAIDTATTAGGDAAGAPVSAVGGSPADGQKGYFTAMAAAALTTELQEAGLLLDAAPVAAVPVSSPITTTTAASFSSFVSASASAASSSKQQPGGPSSLVDFFAPAASENEEGGFEDGSSVFGPSSAATSTTAGRKSAAGTAAVAGRPSFKVASASALVGRKSGANLVVATSAGSRGSNAGAGPLPPAVPSRFSIGGLASLFGVSLPSSSSSSATNAGQSGQ